MESDPLRNSRDSDRRCSVYTDTQHHNNQGYHSDGEGGAKRITSNGQAVTHTPDDTSPQQQPVPPMGHTNPDNVNKQLSFSKLPNRSKYVMVLCCFAQMCSAISFAVIAPFYPHEAERKGVSATLVGLVFSVFELVNFTTSPFIGKYMTKIGTKFVFISGIFVAGSSSILFGTLGQCPAGMTFFAMSLLCRTFIASGFCAFTVGNFAIVSSEFPSSVATVFGVLETMQGIGLMAGPLFGSVLYELGGFSAPFYCLGGLVLLSAVLIYFLLPDTHDMEHTSSLSLTSFARVPTIAVSLANISMCSLGISFTESTLARHLEDEFDLRVSLIGVLFIISPAIYAFTMPLWGFLVDKKNIMFPIVIIGLLGSVAGYLFIAPSQSGILPSKLWTVILGMSILGISYGPIFLGATKVIVTAALENGYHDNLDTFCLVSGLFYFSYCFGAFVGPFIGGFLTQNIGFPLSFTILSLIHLPNVIASIGFFIHRRRKRKHKTSAATDSAGNGSHGSHPPTTKD